MAKNINRKVTIYINGKEVENTMKGLRAELKRLENEQRNATIGTEEYIAATAKIDELKDYIKKHTGSVKDVEKGWTDTAESLARYSNILMGVQSAFQMIDLGVGKLKDLAKDAAALDDVYADVMKTTGLTHEQVEKLNEAFKQMDTRTSREQLNQLAYEAGKLGINSAEAVAQFVSAADKINIALGDVLGDGAMVTIGKLTEIFESSTKALEGKNLEEKMLSIGSAVNSLGQASTANEGYMVEFMKRLGGIAAQAGLSADQILGFASALDQNGQAVEMSATAFTKMIMQMVKKPEEFVKAAGVSIDEFKRMMDEDMNGTILRVLEGMDSQGGFQQIVHMFNEMGLDGSRAAQAISSLAKHLDQVREAQALASREIATGSSVVNEFNTKNETMQAQAEKAKKKFEEMRIELGNELYPVLIHLQRSGTVLMKGFAGLVQVIKEYPGILNPLIALAGSWLALKAKTLVVLTTQKVKELALNVVKNAGIAIAQRKLMVEQRELEAYHRKRVAEYQEMIAKEQLILTDKAYAATIEGLTRREQAEANIKAYSKNVTQHADAADKAHTATINAKNAAMKATPWGAIIFLATSLITVIHKLITYENDLEKATKEANRQVFEEQGKLKVLKERLEGAAVGSQQYKQALDELRAQYPDIMKRYSDEYIAVNRLKGVYEELSATVQQSVYDRMYAEKAGELQGKLGEQLEKTLRGVSNWVDTALRNFSDAERQHVKQQMNTIVRSFAEGALTQEEALKRMNAVMVKAKGLSSDAQVAYTGLLTGLDKKIKETDKALGDLKTAFNPTDTDPFGVQKMNLEQLNNELGKAERRLASYQRAVDQGRDGFLEKLEEEKKRIDALIKQRDKLQAQQKKVEPETANTTPSGETEKERKAREKAEAAWNRFQQTYEQTMARVNAKTLTGLEAVNAEVDVAIGKMRAMLEAKEVSDPRAVGMLQDLLTAAEAWKKAKFDEYVGKIDKELQKLQKSAARDSDNEMLNKAKSAAEVMRQSYDSTSTLIEQLQADLRNLDAQVLILRDDESAEAAARRTELNDEIEQLKEKVRLLREARSALTESVFHAIDLSVDTGDFGKKQQVQHHEDTAEDLKGLSSLERFLGVGKVYATLLDEINAKYEKYHKQLKKNAAAARYMAQVEHEHGNEDKAKEYEAQAAALEKQAEDLKDLSDAAKKLAKEDALTKTLDKWIEGFESLSKKALSIWSNITTMLNNRGDQELQDAENRKDEQLEVLDEQLEQGLISQEEYEKRKNALEQEYSDKEKAIRLEQWERNQALSYGEAVIEGAAAVLKALNDKTIPSTAARIAMASVMAAQTLTQIMAIANQPKPYAKGGYVQKETVYKAGEAGPEWVASNQLLNNPQTAPVIQALEAYQRGDRRALADIPMAQLNMPVATAAARELGRRSVGAMENTLLSMPTATQKFSVDMPDSGEMMELWRELATYLKDPNNRRAVISRQTMTDFETNENFLRNKARL